MPLATGISTLATRIGVEFKSVRAALDAKLDKSIPTIPGSANLDTYTTSGTYHQGTSANAATGTNYPVPRAGLLEVDTPDGGFFTYQRYTEYGSPTSNPTTAGSVFVRTKYGTTAVNGTWTPWGPRLSGLSDLSALAKRGTYAARPAATTVLTGTEYFATDVLETYRATGTDGLLATAWLAIPTGGTELAWAQVTSTQSIPSTTTTQPIDLPGMQISIMMPERPVEIRAQLVGRMIIAPPSGNDLCFQIRDVTTTATPVILNEVHGGFSATTGDYKSLSWKARVSGATPGTTRIFSVICMARTTADSSLIASATFPASIQAIAL